MVVQSNDDDNNDNVIKQSSFFFFFYVTIYKQSNIIIIITVVECEWYCTAKNGALGDTKKIFKNLMINAYSKPSIVSQQHNVHHQLLYSFTLYYLCFPFIQFMTLLPFWLNPSDQIGRAPKRLRGTIVEIKIVAASTSNNVFEK